MSYRVAHFIGSQGTARMPLPANVSNLSSGESVPLTVWPRGQTATGYQRAGCYLPTTTRHPQAMVPELAQRIVATFSGPEAKVLDPFAGAGTVLVEAAALGRRVAGIEVEASWFSLARAHLHATTHADTEATTTVRLGDARGANELLGELAAQVDLVATAPPRQATLVGAGESANLAGLSRREYRRGLHMVWTSCYYLLRPGGLLVTVTRRESHAGRLQDTASTTLALARAAGFRYLQHIVALHAVIDDSTLRLDSPPAAGATGDSNRCGVRHQLAHEDVCVLVKPPIDEDDEDGSEAYG